MIPKIHFNDQTLACFFYELGRLHEYKPHIKKSSLAAINFGLQVHHLENIHSFKHLYPDLHLILKQWDCQLKVTPYFVQKGERFDVNSVSLILSMTPNNDMELRDLAATVVIIFTGLRAISLYIATTNNWVKCPADSASTRHWRLILPRTKTDPKGDGPVANRTSVVPCICLTNLEKKEKAKFMKEMKHDPFCICVGPCPYDVLTRYMNKCPQKSHDNDATELSFLRAVTARGERTLTEFKLGEGEVKKCFERVNSKLPTHLKLDKVGNNVGRYTTASICMNNNVDSLTTSMATKHKCLESLKGISFIIIKLIYICLIQALYYK